MINFQIALLMVVLSLFSINVWAGTQPDRFLTPACAKLLASPDKQQIEIWSNAGGAMKPAEMILFDNGLLVINSEILSKRVEKRYFQWAEDAGKTKLNITICDSRVNGLLELESLNVGIQVLKVDERTKSITYAIQKVDKHEQTITYAIRENGIVFSGWNFYKK